MAQASVVLDVAVFVSLISAYGLARDFHQVKGLMQEMPVCRPIGSMFSSRAGLDRAGPRVEARTWGGQALW